MISCRNIFSSISRLAPSPMSFLTRNISLGATSNIYTSSILCAEPLKKRKKLDPAVVRAREERKKKKIEKQIRRLERNAKSYKPIEECEIPMNIAEEKELRTRTSPELPESELERRALLEKRWAKYKESQHLNDLKMIDRLFYSQQKALDELRLESEELYQEAIQTDFRLIPFTCQGPVQTPAIENYDSPDGDYLDISKKWE